VNWTWERRDNAGGGGKVRKILQHNGDKTALCMCSAKSSNLVSHETFLYLARCFTAKSSRSFGVKTLPCSYIATQIN
jgi:hypothetical protein